MTTELPNTLEYLNHCTGILQRPRINHSVITLEPRSTAARIYFRRLHAAEMAAWELTGGDYAVASSVPAHSRAHLLS